MPRSSSRESIRKALLYFACENCDFSAVLREITNLKQESGAGRRRWFESDGFDLVVWLGTNEAVTGFQICYDFGRGEHALTWRCESGFAHHAVDTGDATPFKNETPVLIPVGAVPWRDVADLFARRGEALEPALRLLVGKQLAAGTESRTGG
jgi:hypothetical protein